MHHRPLRTATALTLLLATACATTPPPRTSLDAQPPALLGAFFGLDNALPRRAVMLCRQAPGADGMPVTFSRRVRSTGRDGTVNAQAFTVITRSGARKTPACATLRPANEASEGHTVLLIGDLGDDARDPPVRVEVTGALPLAGEADGKGLHTAVTPLRAGPSIVLAVAYPPDAIESDCPASTRQIVMAVWAGGVTPAPGKTDRDHLAMYRVTTAAGASAPSALGDLGDGDNYVHLCLDTPARALRVRASGGVLVDPRGDRNPDTEQAITR